MSDGKQPPAKGHRKNGFSVPKKKSDISIAEAGANMPAKLSRKEGIKTSNHEEKLRKEKKKPHSTLPRTDASEHKSSAEFKKRKIDDINSEGSKFAKKGKKEHTVMIQTYPLSPEGVENIEENKEGHSGFKPALETKLQGENLLMKIREKAQNAAHPVRNHHSDIKKRKKLNSQGKIEKCTEKEIPKSGKVQFSLVKSDHAEDSTEGEEAGTWVQCSRKTCNKWRYLADVEDPILVPDDWDCTMNSDLEHNSCEFPEVNYNDIEHIYTKFTIGSVVWAKVDGYPWWPAMIECDPDTHAYFEIDTPTDMVPLRYHVSFFDEQVTRSWVRARCVLPYIRDGKIKTCNPDGSSAFTKDIKAAMVTAEQALTMSLQERIHVFGFLKRFSAKRQKSWKRKNLKKHIAADDSADQVSSETEPACHKSVSHMKNIVRARAVGKHAAANDSKQHIEAQSALEPSEVHKDEMMKLDAEINVKEADTPNKPQAASSDKPFKSINTCGDPYTCRDDGKKETRKKKTKKEHKVQSKNQEAKTPVADEYSQVNSYEKLTDKKMKNGLEENSVCRTPGMSDTENKCPDHNKLAIPNKKRSKKTEKGDSKSQVDTDGKNISNSLVDKLIQKSKTGSRKDKKQKNKKEEFSEANVSTVSLNLLKRKDETENKLATKEVGTSENNDRNASCHETGQNQNESRKEKSSAGNVIKKHSNRSSTNAKDVKLPDVRAYRQPKKSVKIKGEGIEMKQVVDHKGVACGMKYTESPCEKNTNKSLKKLKFTAPNPKAAKDQEVHLSVTDHWRAANKHENETHQQIVPDIDNETLENLTQLEISNLSENNMEEPAGHCMMKNTCTGSLDEEKEHLNFGSVKSPEIISNDLNDGDSNDSDDFILRLETDDNVDDITCEQVDGGHLISGHFGEKCFYEFAADSD